MSDNEPKKIEYPITHNYSPEVPIEVIGVKQNKKLVAVVDTGFTGFMQIPLAEGIACNLRLWGTGRSKLADGSVVKNLNCVGEVTFAGKKLFGIISLSETGDDCLLGMDFINELKMDFITSPTDGKATFIDREVFKQTESPAIVVPTEVKADAPQMNRSETILGING